ncbi:hypothetical protein [Lacipirellula parvula]|uniref:Uncharacterized protein n=1 Tax=Lacipirellula parvula TaxID=2650471 RepID=A0A5K7XCR4_9BACT|nr:hypothetical protein [Lacipirellula parvula]BBO34584.1 hypothetical protein PLANPX_4196 [Lacipirellula parvula]
MKPHIVGMLAGWALWAAFFAVAYVVMQRGTAILPEPGVFKNLISVITIAAMPIAIGGFLFVWGDGAGQPPPFMTTMWFNIVFGLILYGALGAMAGAIYGRLRKKRS